MNGLNYSLSMLLYLNIFELDILYIGALNKQAFNVVELTISYFFCHAYSLLLAYKGQSIFAGCP